MKTITMDFKTYEEERETLSEKSFEDGFKTGCISKVAEIIGIIKENEVDEMIEWIQTSDKDEDIITVQLLKLIKEANGKSTTSKKDRAL